MQIKRCGVFRQEDADYVNEAMPDYAGLVFWEKSRRRVDEKTAAQIRRRLHPSVKTVGVFVDEAPERVAKLLDTGILDIAQLHGRESEEQICFIKARAGKPVWKAVEIAGREDVERWNASAANCLLLDGGKGGGKPFDWTLLEKVNRPFFLAGGLDRERLALLGTLRKESRKVCENLLGIDVSSGVETDGVKDREKILEIVRQARSL